MDAVDKTSGIEKVEYHIDGELKKALTYEPYERTWDETAIGSFTIEAVAHDNAGNMATDEQWVRIFSIRA